MISNIIKYIKPNNNEQLIETEYINQFSDMDLLLFKEKPDSFKNRKGLTRFTNVNYLAQHDLKVRRMFAKYDISKYVGLNQTIFFDRTLLESTLYEKILDCTGVFLKETVENIKEGWKEIKKQNIFQPMPAFASVILLFFITFMFLTAVDSFHNVANISNRKFLETANENSILGLNELFHFNYLDSLILKNPIIMSEIRNDNIGNYLVIVSMFLCLALSANFIGILKSKKKKSLLINYSIGIILITLTMFLNWAYLYMKSIDLRNKFIESTSVNTLPSVAIWSLIGICCIYSVVSLAISIFKMIRLIKDGDNNE